MTEQTTAAPAAPEVSPAVLAALAQLEAAKENLRKVRAAESEARRGGTAAARTLAKEAARRQAAREGAVQAEVDRAAKIGRDPEEVRRQATAVQAAGFERVHHVWSRGDRLLQLGTAGWSRGQVGQRDWTMLSLFEASPDDRDQDLGRYLSSLPQG